MTSRPRTILAADLFCGAGGASTSLLQACRDRGLHLDLLAINHWPVAVETHRANFPGARHLCEAVDKVNPRDVVPGGRLHVLLAGPSCQHFSRARGGRPVSDQQRSSAWSVVRWCEELYVDTVLVENVPEFLQFGPVSLSGHPIKAKRGETFNAWVGALRSLGYRVEWKVLNAADYGDPTTRRRLFVLARRDRKRIEWPEATHSRQDGANLFGTMERWRAARDVIDWSLPGASIFRRRKPLAPATMRRIVTGLERFASRELQPFLVILRNNASAQSVDKPLRTISAGGIHAGLCEPFLVPHYGERAGQTPRVHSVSEPLPSIPASGGGKFEIVEPFVIPQQSGGVARSVREPLPTIASDGAQALVEPFLTAYYGAGGNIPVSDPVPTIPSRDRLGLVMPVVDGRALDIRVRMLQPHELAAAMSFPAEYRFAGTKGDQVRQIGNAWPVSLGRALCLALLEGSC